ncbi:MAG TPA: hypothetical protein VHH35_05840 [Pyrinomonadaceae bacterium]|nr:hypothetical protein [Pyrinomonadaceae bacterium]
MRRKETVLQRLFPAFPTGWPGVGLLLLRGLVAFILIKQAAAFSGWLMTLVVLTGAGFLLLGTMTPVVAIVTGVSSLALAFSNGAGIEMAVLTFAIALLGPGAYSIDARMFGRRKVFIPKRAIEMSAATDRPDPSLPTHATDHKPGAGV